MGTLLERCHHSAPLGAVLEHGSLLFLSSLSDICPKGPCAHIVYTLIGLTLVPARTLREHATMNVMGINRQPHSLNPTSCLDFTHDAVGVSMVEILPGAGGQGSGLGR